MIDPVVVLATMAAGVTIVAVYLWQIQHAVGIISIALSGGGQRRCSKRTALSLFAVCSFISLCLEFSALSQVSSLLSQAQGERASAQAANRKTLKAIRDGNEAELLAAFAGYPEDGNGVLSKLELLHQYLSTHQGKPLSIAVLRQIDSRKNSPTHSGIWQVLPDRIRDPDQPLEVRQRLVLLWATSVGAESRPDLFTVLDELSPGVFALPLGQAIVRLDQPTDIVEFLGSKGPKAIDALPYLVASTGHSNKWTFVPAVIRAMAAVGQHEVVDELNVLSKSERREVREAAETELAGLK